MGRIGALEVVLIVLVILLLFGATRLPKALGGLGKGIREFKKGMRGEDDSDQPKKSDEPADRN